MCNGHRETGGAADGTLHNGTMVYRGTAMATASCRVAFVQPDGVSVYYDRNQGGYYSPDSGYATSTVQVFYE